MSRTDSPLKRSIGLSGAIWFLIAVLAVIAIGAAVAAGRYAMAVVGVVFVVAAITLGYRASAARRAAKTDGSPQPPA